MKGQKNLLKILFVEDVPSDVDLAVLELRKEKIVFEHSTVCTGNDLIRALNEFKPDLIISDYMMPSFNGLQALKATKEFNPDIPFILYTGSVNEETAVECLKAGAEDYIIKEHMTRLPFAVKEALEKARISKEKKASEILLKENEQKLQSIFSSAPVGIGLVVNRILIEVNDFFCTLTGYLRHELVDQPSDILYFLFEDFLNSGNENLREIFEKGTGTIETKINHKNGKILDIILSSTPLDSKDFSRGVTFTVLDITERKQAEKLIHESEEKYRGIFENVQDVYYEISLKGVILEISPSIRTLFKGQYQTTELIGKLIFDFCADPIEAQAVFSELRTKGTVTDSEINLKNRDGTFIPSSISAKLILNQNGIPEKVIGNMHDITDRKNVTEALKLAKEKAEMSDKLKTDFLNNISHEVRTPLNGILGFAEIISLQDLSYEEKKDSLAMLFESSNRLLNTITNYMDISLITSGNLTTNIKEFEPSTMLRRIQNNFEDLCLNKSLELKLEYEKNDDDYLLSDPEICQKIISHFIDNAIKFTEKGSIRFGFSGNSEQIQFYVRDTGIGINAESFQIIFDRFSKENNNSYKVTEGSGLGLSIAKGMAEAIGGKISLESKPGAGSCFYLSLPHIKNIEKNVSIDTSERLNTGGTRELMILIAEDDMTNFYYLNALLTRETGARILYASNGREAIELFRSFPAVKLVLMDIKMPGIDGFEAMKEIKFINPSVPIIAITAYAMSGDEERIIASGFDGYLSKPLNKKSLLNKISGFITISPVKT